MFGVAPKEVPKKTRINLKSYGGQVGFGGVRQARGRAMKKGRKLLLASLVDLSNFRSYSVFQFVFRFYSVRFFSPIRFPILISTQIK